MESPIPASEILEYERLEGKLIIRRFTDELAGYNELERSTKAAQVQIDKEEEAENQMRLKLLYEDESPEGISTSPHDFEVAEIARTALQEMVDKFIEDTKPSALQRLGIQLKSAKTKANEILQDSVSRDFNELKTSVDNLGNKWKESHGPIYKAFKTLCRTFDDHKTIFSIFPSQNNYASVLCGGLSCLVKAANNHSDIAETLAKSIASISEKVATCSGLVASIKTQRLRRKLADIYARMFDFYQNAIEWYLRSKVSRLFLSFNENLKKGFESAKAGLEDCITELYREASVGSIAMLAILSGKVTSLEAEVRRQRQNYSSQDISAGHRMVVLMEASWMDSKYPKPALESVQQSRLALEPSSRIQEVSGGNGITRAQASDYSSRLEPFIIGDEGSGLFGAGRIWLAEEEVLPKLRAWMIEDKTPSTLWVSGPYEACETTSSKAVALAVVAAAWQAETPLLSHFCQRPQRDKLRPGMSTEQVGLIGVVYSLIYQLLQFSGLDNEELDVNKESFAALNGEAESWRTSLQVLRALLDRTPVLMYCVIDGLDGLEWASGSEWTRQFLDILIARQRKPETVFNLLLTTSGQSRVLPVVVQSKERVIATKGARQVARVGRRI